MDNVKFLGEYITTHATVASDLPLENGSGLWRAWQASDGRYIIQALDADKNPWGDTFFIAAEIFKHVLTSLPPEKTVSDVARNLRADTPNLLDIWFKHKITADIDENGVSLPTPPEMPLPPVMAPNILDSMYAGAEPLQSSLSDAGIKTVPSDDLSTIGTAFDVNETSSVATDEYLLERWSHVALESASQQNASLLGLDALAEEGVDADSDRQKDQKDAHSIQLEALMRKEFSEYELHLTEAFQPGLESDIETFLQRKGEFTWKQKYMFSEFGMTLRRKHKPRLALKCHLRALELAPEDASILFNLARTEYELGNLSVSREYLQKSLVFAPDFGAAVQFLDFLGKQE